MNKKGFTLFEIIVCIGVLAILGVASFFGVRLITNNIRVNKLSQITDKAVQAAQVYLETNAEVYNQLYKNQNGVVLPLNVLVNEGLLSLENTDLNNGDIEGEYVITALSTATGNSEDCVDIRTETSWYEGSSAPIYICTKNDGSSNLMMVNNSEIGNQNIVKKEPYIYKGISPNNFVMYNGNGPYRIYYIDTDDSIVLVNNSSGFGSVFNGKTDDLKGYTTSNYTYKAIPASDKIGFYDFNTGTIVDKTEKILTGADYANIAEQLTKKECDYVVNKVVDTVISEASHESCTSCGNRCYSCETIYHGYPSESTKNYTYENKCTSENIYYWLTQYGTYSNNKNSLPRKIRLNKCMKIKSGTGQVYEPYELDDSKC